MEIQLLIIITDKLEEYRPIFNQTDGGAGFLIEQIGFEEFVNGRLTEEVQKRKAFNILVALDERLYAKEEVRIRAYFQDTCSNPFANFLYLYTSPEKFKENNSKIRVSFLLFSDIDYKHQAFYLSIFVEALFSNAKIAYRLSDYIFQSFKGVVSSEILLKKKEEIERLNKELERMNKIDTLTQLYNRRALYYFLEKERKRCYYNLSQTGTAHPGIEHMLSPDDIAEFKEDSIKYTVFSLMMVDLDHFKLINDVHGHLVGDKVLKAIGKIFRKSGILREEDIASRFGGEEFVLILPGTTAQQAAVPAKRLQEELAKWKFTGEGQKEFYITMSIGISQFNPRDKGNDDIVFRADQALYYAKEHGRNRYRIYEQSSAD